LQSLKPSCLLERHFPDFIPATKQKPRKLYCLLQERPKERVNMHVPCHDCNARLCPFPSFHTYHTEATVLTTCAWHTVNCAVHTFVVSVYMCF
jgi:hypothetical protein